MRKTPWKIEDFQTTQSVFERRDAKYFNRFLVIFSVISVIAIFLPWTQTVSGQGYVTTLKPDHRPQTIQSVIPGRIEEWYVQEGDFVKRGDTILRISEIKSEYFDPSLLDRTEQQLDAKELSVVSYDEKIKALENQMTALMHLDAGT